MAKKSATHGSAPDDDQEIEPHPDRTLPQDLPADPPPLSAQLQQITGQLARQQSSNAPIPADMVGRLADIVRELEDQGL